MKLQYLGTAAAEGIPAAFCTCPVCKHARQEKGREIRSRSQMLLDGELLIGKWIRTSSGDKMQNQRTWLPCGLIKRKPLHLYWMW